VSKGLERVEIGTVQQIAYRGSTEMRVPAIIGSARYGTCSNGGMCLSRLYLNSLCRPLGQIIMQLAYDDSALGPVIFGTVCVFLVRYRQAFALHLSVKSMSHEAVVV